MPGRARWPHLFRPLWVAGLELPNRMVMPAMDPSLAAPDGGVTDAMIRHYVERARGGVGLIVTGNMACEARGRISPWMPLVSDDRFIAGLTRLTDAIHAENGRVFLQVSHGGRQTLSHFAGTQPVSASAIPCPVLREPPRALEDEEVDEIADAFAAAAERAQTAGADGVEFHMAHGYLVCQFLSPYSNHRDDRWGGDEAGRARLAVEIVRRSRARVGPDFPLQCRLSADERVDGGITPPLAINYAKRLVAAGASALSISACNYESYRYNMPSYYLPEATYASLARTVRCGIDAAVPVIAVGRFRTGDLAEATLVAGDADLVAMGRALLADPSLPRRLIDNEPNRVRPCVACNRCAESVTLGAVRCLVNPEVGRNPEAARPAVTSKRVAVLGGGPAGVTAAIEAAKRGHRVTIYEATGRIGGKTWASAAPPQKADFGRYAAWLEDQIAASGIDVHLNHAVTPADLDGLDTDAVIVAVGSTVAPAPDIDGLAALADAGLLLRPEAALQDHLPRRHVLILGGGPEGCEIADAMIHRGDRPAVTLVELRLKIGLGLPTSVRGLLDARLRAAGVDVRTRTTVGAFADDGIALRDRRGRSHGTLPNADLVVLAIGVRARDEWLAAASAHKHVVVIGDTRRPATILEAVYDGWCVGRSL